MTESEYLVSADPVAMWHALERGMRSHGHEEFIECGSRRGKPSFRKMRLWACACCRSAWERLGDAGRAAVAVAEQYAAGLADDAARGNAAWAAIEASGGRCRWGEGFDDHNGPPRLAAWAALKDDRLEEVLDTFLDVGDGRPGVPAALQADLFREIMGNPFQRLTFIDVKLSAEIRRHTRYKVVPPPGRSYDGARCLTPTVRAVAQAAYADRDWAALPVLADALEEAGVGGTPCPACRGCGHTTERAFGLNGSEWHEVPCRECGGTGVAAEPLLVHLRQPGPHALGCWALDCILCHLYGPAWS